MTAKLGGLGLTLCVLAAASVCAAQASAPASAPAAADGEWKIERTAEFIRITRGGRPVLLYRCQGAPKPYVKELYTPGGVQLLLDSPPDHVHHRGLMFALAVDGVSFWEQSGSAGREISRSLEARPVGANAAILEELDWVSPAEKPLLHERRTVQLWGGSVVQETGGLLLDWCSRLELPPGVDRAGLSGNHYFGLGMRIARAADRGGTFIIADESAGEIVRGDEKLYPGAWCAYTAEIEGKTVTLAMLSLSEIPRPTTWFTMATPFAYLSATLRLHKEPLEVTAGQDISLVYGLAVWDGRATAEQIRRTYELWRRLHAVPAK